MIPSASIEGGRRIKVIVGHYGSGKTEIAINLALLLAKRGPALLIDLDIVNPFFRSAEAKPLLESRGVEVIHPAYALSGVDIPVLPAEIERAFVADMPCVFDVGGDDDGAAALGRYFARFEREPADVFFAINPFRPRTSEVSQVLSLMEAVSARARVPITGLINSANLGDETRPEDFLKGRAFAEAVSRESGIPIASEAGLARVLERVPTVYTTLPLTRYLKPEWMD